MHAPYAGQRFMSCLTIPEGIRSLQDYAFSGCCNLNKILLPEGIQAIGHEAFAHCEELTELYLPASVSHMGADAFDGCPKGVIVIRTTGSGEKFYSKSNFSWKSMYSFFCTASTDLSTITLE